MGAARSRSTVAATSSEPLRVAVAGLGALGREVVRALAGSLELQLVGLVDPAAHGQAWREVEPRLPEGTVAGSLRQVLQARPALLLDTRPGLEGLDEALSAGLPVASAAAAMAFPWLSDARRAEALEARAVEAGVAVLGLTPGSSPARLVAALAQASGPVQRLGVEWTWPLEVEPLSDEAAWGLGLSEADFMERAAREELGLPGLQEVAALCALAAGLDADDFEESVAPLFGDEPVRRGPRTIAPGHVLGLAHEVVARLDGEEQVRLDVTFSAAERHSAGQVSLHAAGAVTRLSTSVGPGLLASCAAELLSAAPRLLTAEAGLLTVLDLPAGR